MNTPKKRILIVGGVAGGATCAARARRLCETCDILVFERGPHVSFANCGLPYFVGDVIASEAKLLVVSPEDFRNRFNIDVHTETEVTRIDRHSKTIEARDLKTGAVRQEPYDALVLATGAKPVRPPLPGIDLPGIHVLRTIPDSRKIKTATARASRALIVGGGFIGLEMAENLVGLGLEVILLELADQVLPPLDPEMAAYAAERLKSRGVCLRLGEGVSAFEKHPERGLNVLTSKGCTLSADMVILGIGVRPESALAAEAGLELGALGGIRVDEYMRTSDPAIWAVGDVVEVKNLVTGEWQLVPLAGPANRQGRVAATAILHHFDRNDDNQPPLKFDGVLGTAVCEVFGLTIACTGANEKLLRRAGMNYQMIYLHPGHHASYFPGARPIHMKLLFSKADGRILGAQAVGELDVARRIDVIATAMMQGASVFDLEDLELCYAPQFGAAKDPVNLAGMIAANHLRGDLPLADWDQLATTPALLVDVRNETEFAGSHVPNARNLPLETLRDRLHELPRDRDIWLICGVGQRAYYAFRLLAQNGFQVKVLSGGMQTYQARIRAGNRW
ncbi:FAD-dependent oxidoreductase [Methylocaldum szegediense]|uniref:NADPH-dependent 2,4-dienoyl-CoA reductase/sulfur reductase-like enzyme n=1 Tax=Methylocaldum szegediense TaxID=73780 RepID=A0ABM9I2A4_9GAMM|nr:FAD-dependent oxidoreductase [Methylocaldum szegediense]CAI8843380.1 NADPH-dependent 2,4-dienoyl-CoA reductase/sulfur reductase-like enzyme [Methylocaldum szegediense]